jgi:hypothetical protein
MQQEISIMGSTADFGFLVRVQKEKAYAGKKNCRAVFHTRYTAGFYNPNNKTIAWYGSEKPVTTIVTTHTLSQMKNFLKENGYIDWTIEQI